MQYDLSIEAKKSVCRKTIENREKDSHTMIFGKDLNTI
jgi:hypothetical protein